MKGVRRRFLAVAACIVVASTAGGCALGELQFRNDHRLSFGSPEANENVELPVTVTWSMDDFEVVGLDGSERDDRGAFVVFVDRSPMPVGEDLSWVTSDVASCATDPACPSAEQLAERDVYVVTDPKLALERLPDVSGRIGKEQHYVNIVLVDGTGHRIGESAWYRPFTTDRRDS